VTEPSPQPSAAEDHALLAAFRPRVPRSFELTRFVYLRSLGFIYVIAFAILNEQQLPLFGSDGLLPATRFVARLHQGSFWQEPTLFWFDVSDGALVWGARIGLGLALAVMLGVDNALVMAALWVLYLSFVHVGQLFYGYGWETLLLEAGFLGIFMCPVTHALALHDPSPAPLPVMIMLRWLLFRVMFGAGLIKLRGDPCWRDLTCLIYHYETQPNPHVLSWLLYQAPPWFHRIGAAFNHFVELLVPWFLLVPWPRLRHIAAAFTIAFQTILILSGNLSFLNWLTIAIAFGCVDDAVWEKLLPRALVRRAAALRERPQLGSMSRALRGRSNHTRNIVVGALSVLVALLSISPIMNMLSPHQRMNTSFEPLHLVNSYGAFGSIGRVRDEIIIEGTSDARPGPATKWRAYEFKCKPGRVDRMPCWITPYHYRLDWQMWFAAMSDAESEPWLVHMIYKLLHNDRGVISLLANDPFPNRPPRYIRAELYRYQFTHFGSRAWWTRRRIASYLPPVSSDNPSLLEFLAQYGLVRGERIDMSR
jgi:hypothetical protein